MIDMKYSNQILGLVIGVVMLCVVVVPLIQETTADLTQTEKTYNEGVRYSLIGTTEVLTLTIGDSDVTFANSAHSETCTLPRTPAYYQVCLSDTFSMSINNTVSYSSTSNTSTVYKSSGTFTFDRGTLKYGETTICTYTHALVPDAKGDLVRVKTNVVKYIEEDTTCYGYVPKSIVATDLAYGWVEFNSEGVTGVSLTTITGNTPTTWTSTTGLATTFVDLDTESDPYTFTSSPQLSYTGGTNGNLTYIWIPYLISHDSPSTVATLLSLLPLIMAVGLLYWAYRSIGGRHD